MVISQDRLRRVQVDYAELGVVTSFPVFLRYRLRPWACPLPCRFSLGSRACRAGDSLNAQYGLWRQRELAKGRGDGWQRVRKGGEYIEDMNGSGSTTVAASSSSLLLLIHNLCAALDLVMRRRHDFGSSDDDLAYYVSTLFTTKVETAAAPG